MRIILLILLFTSTLFSQKLWEIEVDPSDYLRDVVEIPNSDLLLFTYNTGKLEIRNSQDGSFVNQLIKKPNESGELRISSNGQLYHYQHHADTIEFRDILTNEATIRISPEIEELEGNPIFDRKVFQRCEIYDNNSKIVGSISYIDNEDSRNSTYRFVIYNILTKEIEYKSTPYKGYYEGIKNTYKSPDDKYFIEFALYHPRARMFNLETREYEFEFDEENGDIMPVGIFINNHEMRFTSSRGFSIYSFPNLKLKSTINFPNEFEFNISGDPKLTICDNQIFLHVYKRIEGMQNKFEKWYIMFDQNNFDITFNPKSIWSNFEYSNSFLLKNCDKLIVDRDFDYKEGLIVCYDFNTLDIEEKLESSIFPNPTSDIINIDTKEATSIELFDIFGNKLLADYNTKLDISHLSQGTYYIRFLGQTRMVVKI